MGLQQVHTILALDIGMQRTGVAIANSIAKIPGPLKTVTDQSSLNSEVAALISQHNVTAIVVGLPRNLNGEETSQTTYVRQVTQGLEEHLTVPVHFIDEAVTSAKAEGELKARKKPYQKEDIDMLAATYILEDFLREHPEVLSV